MERSFKVLSTRRWVDRLPCPVILRQTGTVTRCGTQPRRDGLTLATSGRTAGAEGAQWYSVGLVTDLKVAGSVPGRIGVRIVFHKVKGR